MQAKNPENSRKYYKKPTAAKAARLTAQEMIPKGSWQRVCIYGSMRPQDAQARTPPSDEKENSKPKMLAETMAARHSPVFAPAADARLTMTGVASMNKV